MKRLLSMLLAISLLLGLGATLGAAEVDEETREAMQIQLQEAMEMSTPDELYASYTEMLDMYLRGVEDAPDPEWIRMAFDLLKYRCSKQYEMYVGILIDVEKGDFAAVTVPLKVLGISPTFQAELEAEDFPYYAIKSVEILTAYVEARRAEHNGDFDTALEYYMLCAEFYDAADRMLNLGAMQAAVDVEKLCAQLEAALLEEDYDTALSAAEKLIAAGDERGKQYYDVILELKAIADAEAAAAPAATPPPAQAGGNDFVITGHYNKTNVALSWNPVNGADTYRIYRARGKEGEFKQVGEATKSSYIDHDFVKGIFNGYYVEALSGGKVLATSAITTVYASNDPTPTPTKAPTKAPTATPTKAPTATPTVTPTPAPVWGAWSAWSTTAVTATATRQVETKVVEEPVYGTKYHYNRWTYKNTDGGTSWSYTKYTGDYYSSGGRWEYASSMTRFTPNGYASGHQRWNGSASGYGGSWFNESTSTVQTGTKKVTYYRYRDRQN